MKKLIVTLSESDPDLAARLLSSAKKAAIYKNYTLNNYDNAALNPRNFRSDGTLNIFQEWSSLKITVFSIEIKLLKQTIGILSRNKSSLTFIEGRRESFIIQRIKVKIILLFLVFY